MASVSFASAIQRHHPCPKMTVGGTTVRAALQTVFAAHLPLRSHVLGGQQIEDRTWLSENEGENWQPVSSQMPPVYCRQFG